jgi:hypothetical protein
LTTAADLVAGLRRRGVELLTADDGRLGVRPAGQLTPEERAALVARKAEVLALLRAEQRPARTEPSDRWADDVPERPCGLCRHQPLAEVRDWPVPGHTLALPRVRRAAGAFARGRLCEPVG